MNKVERAAKDLLLASKAYRDASNALYCAQNPEDFADGVEIPPLDEAVDEQHEAYLALESAEYYMRKALK
jgi:hypothetical protein